MEQLKTRINLSTWIAFSMLAIAVLSYAINFWLQLDYSISSKTDDWGQFGDYVGGLLNPLIAFLAFYWLTQSIILQKEELSETKMALRDSAIAQSNTAKINALSTLISSYNNDISNLRENIHFVSSQLNSPAPKYSPSGNLIAVSQAIDLLSEMNKGLASSLKNRLAAIDQITELLNQH